MWVGGGGKAGDCHHHDRSGRDVVFYVCTNECKQEEEYKVPPLLLGPQVSEPAGVLMVKNNDTQYMG